MLRLFTFLFIIVSFSNCKSIINRKNKVTIQLNELKKGTLLVRLPTNHAKIARLTEMGKLDLAKKEETINQQFQSDIINSFTSSFDYCPVYFFYSNHAEAIKKGDIEEKIFDKEKNFIHEIKTPLDQIFYAEFGQVHQNEVAMEKDGKKVKVAGFGGKDALVIRTSEGFQPQRPFPYAVDYKSLFNGSLNLTVRKLNDRLYSTHSKMERRRMRRTRRGK